MLVSAPLVALSRFDDEGASPPGPAKEYRKVTTQASTNPLRRVPVQGRSVARVQRMLDACAELVDEIGYEALTTTLLAERAGVAIGSVYQFFPDKRAIVQALALRNLEAYLAKLSARSEAVEFQHWWDVVDAAIDEYIAMHRTMPGFRTLHFCDVVDVHLLAQLTGLGVAEPHPVADAQPVRGRSDDRRLYLAGPLGPGQPEPGRQPGRRLADRAGLTGRDPAAAEYGRDPRAGAAYHRQG